MRAVFGLVLLIGMGLAGFAVYMVRDHFETQSVQLQRERDRAASAIVTVDVYSPNRPLNYGELITPADVRLIKYAQDFLPEGVFRTEQELFPQGPDKPRVATRPMSINEPILAVKVTEAGARRGITALLDRGMRAFPLPNNVTQAFSQELRPTDRIDLYWSGKIGNRRLTRLIMTGLEIIAIDATSGVVLQVSPEQFAALAAAQDAGRLSLTPVGQGDDSVIDDVETDIIDVLGIETVAPEEVIEDRRCFVTQGFGANAQKIEIDCEE